ncbi:MAG: ABC transporter permease subunit [Candidatus Tectomicrobia bacterium]|uniref:ABC transporter permease subunit n=1 Tax=Tectimicrobiota bacterium TaxID=2528274 RepID=A0A937VZ05_UNCTE|nr:ABC transporter permease subunit [Candidatus Tectomicrobia bacterium]
MWAYILKRLLLMIPTLCGIVLVTFIVLQLVPGGPVERMIAQLRTGTRAGEGGAAGFAVQGDQRQRTAIQQEQIEYFQKLYGFDQPLHVQLGTWMIRLFTFDFGESYYRHTQVVDLVIDKLPVSISLGAWSFLITYLACIPLGIRKAVRHGSRFDALTSMLILVGYSIPGFVLGIFLIVLFGGGSFWSVFPLRGLTSDGFAELTWWRQILDYLWHLVLPLTCEVIGSFAVLTLLTKNSFLDEIHRQYVQTARAKGLSPRRVLFKHVFRNAIIPIILGFPSSFLALFFTGSLLIETLFSLDGLGLLSYEAIISRDYPVVMATLFVFSLLALVGNLLSDLSLMLVDPRISFESAPR